MTGKLFLVCFLVYCLDALYRVVLKALALSHVEVSRFLTWFPRNALFVISVCLQLYVVTNHFCTSSRKKEADFVIETCPWSLSEACHETCKMPFP